jgi:hypothetical protein
MSPPKIYRIPTHFVHALDIESTSFIVVEPPARAAEANSILLILHPAIIGYQDIRSFHFHKASVR